MKNNFHSQVTYFHEYVYYTATSFGPKLRPSSGHSNTRKLIHKEIKILVSFSNFSFFNFCYLYVFTFLYYYCLIMTQAQAELITV